jgi:hypothetical protein
MSVKPELALDVCWEVYRGAREVLESKRGISALNWKDTGKFLWRPDYRQRCGEELLRRGMFPPRNYFSGGD